MAGVTEFKDWVPRIFVPVGVPGVGKTTFGRHTLGEATHEVSSDSVRFGLLEELGLKSYAEIHDPEKKTEYNLKVWASFDEQLEHCLETNYMGVWADATNLKPERRQRYYELAKQFETEVHVFMFQDWGRAFVQNQDEHRQREGTVVPADDWRRMKELYMRAEMDIKEEPYTSISWIGHFQCRR